MLPLTLSNLEQLTELSWWLISAKLRPGDSNWYIHDCRSILSSRLRFENLNIPPWLLLKTMYNIQTFSQW